jgi:hypothetical protein
LPPTRPVLTSLGLVAGVLTVLIVLIVLIVLSAVS